MISCKQRKCVAVASDHSTHCGILNEVWRGSSALDISMPLLTDPVCASAALSPCAARLAQETGSEALSDLHIFAQAQRVIQSLKQHDCSAALAWCGANRARLKKAKSSLEFKLRLQEFLELVAKVRLARQRQATTHSPARAVTSAAIAACAHVCTV